MGMNIINSFHSYCDVVFDRSQKDEKALDQIHLLTETK